MATVATTSWVCERAVQRSARGLGAAGTGVGPGMWRAEASGEGRVHARGEGSRTYAPAGGRDHEPSSVAADAVLGVAAGAKLLVGDVELGRALVNRPALVPCGGWGHSPALGPSVSTVLIGTRRPRTGLDGLSRASAREFGGVLRNLPRVEVRGSPRTRLRRLELPHRLVQQRGR